MQPRVIVVGWVREASQSLLKEFYLADLSIGVVEEALVRLSRDDEGLEVHKLVEEDNSEFFQA